MTLAQHFLIVSVFPLTFVGLLFYVWFKTGPQQAARQRWLITLLLATAWSTVILRFHGGQTFASELIYGWGVASNYLLSLTALGLLLTTGSYLNLPRPQQITAVFITAALIIIAFALDIHLWGYYLGDGLLGQPIDQFDLWIAVWITSWWVPAFTALLLTLQKRRDTPAQSIQRNQINYWLIVLSLFLLGGSIASIQQHNRPIYQEIGVLLILPAAILGSISIVHSQMPDLQLTVRRLLNRLSGTLIIFGLTWLAFSLLAQGLANLPIGLSHNLVLVLAAFLFTGLFILAYRFVNQVTRRIFLPALTQRDLVLTDYTNALGNLPETDQLARLMLQRIESNLTTTESTCFLAEEGPGGRLLLRPLTSTNPQTQLPQAAVFAADSPFVIYLRQSRMPLVHYDLENLAQFADLPEAEQAALGQWQKMLYLPLKAGETLVGLVALGVKESGEAYDMADRGWLVSLANQTGPLLAQTRHLASLRRINDHLFAQNQALARQQQHVQALTALQHDFVNLISPDLKRPLLSLEKQLRTLKKETPTAPVANQVDQEINQLHANLNQLIHTASHIQKRDTFHFQPVHLDTIIRSVLRKLNTMAEARRILLEYNMGKLVPDIQGDEAQLREAIHNLLHNAIKFNKIGGQVRIDCHVDSGDLCVRINDSGVGIRPDRLPHIWSGLDQLQTNGNPVQRGGMGLTLARFVITAHGGRIEVESSYGQGSTFAVYLPLLLVEDEPAARAAAAQS